VLEKPLSASICGPCWLSLPDISPPFCERCGEPVASGGVSDLCRRCEQTHPAFSMARSAGRYHHALRNLIHAFKYDGRRFLSRPLATLLWQQCGGVLSGADAVVPVPLHGWRKLRRGFNQSDDLARELGLPVWRVLRRVRLGVPQAGLPAAMRQTNVRGAFTLRRAPGGRTTRRLQGATVVLVDDVMTTGATARECSRVLLEAGVRDVRVLTVARAAAAPHA
jgi:ComF family protein